MLFASSRERNFAERKDKIKNEFGSVMNCVCSALKWKKSQTGFPNVSGISMRLLSTFQNGSTYLDYKRKEI